MSNYKVSNEKIYHLGALKRNVLEPIFKNFPIVCSDGVFLGKEMDYPFPYTLLTPLKFKMDDYLSKIDVDIDLYTDFRKNHVIEGIENPFPLLNTFLRNSSKIWDVTWQLLTQIDTLINKEFSLPSSNVNFSYLHKRIFFKIKSETDILDKTKDNLQEKGTLTKKDITNQPFLKCITKDIRYFSFVKPGDDSELNELLGPLASPPLYIITLEPPPRRRYFRKKYFRLLEKKWPIFLTDKHLQEMKKINHLIKEIDNSSFHLLNLFIKYSQYRSLSGTCKYLKSNIKK